MFGSAPCGADVMMEGLIAGLRRVCKLVDGFLFFFLRKNKRSRR